MSAYSQGPARPTTSIPQSSSPGASREAPVNSFNISSWRGMLGAALSAMAEFRNKALGYNAASSQANQAADADRSKGDSFLLSAQEERAAFGTSSSSMNETISDQVSQAQGLFNNAREQIATARGAFEQFLSNLEQAFTFAVYGEGLRMNIQNASRGKVHTDEISFTDQANPSTDQTNSSTETESTT